MIGGLPVMNSGSAPIIIRESLIINFWSSRRPLPPQRCDRIADRGPITKNHNASQ
jgi:hypothetical protein